MLKGECRMKNHQTMRTQLKVTALALLLSTLNPQLSTVFAQGSLTPPGAPAPTMKSLAQIEPRTPISSAPYTITNSGSYYLTTNLATAVSNAITIAASGVTLDLNGFTLSSTVANAANGGSGILLTSGLSDITICNGHISSGVTNSGNVFGGSGFGYGVFYSGNAPSNVRVKDVSVTGVLHAGIYLGFGNVSAAASCTVKVAGGDGIRADCVSDAVAQICGGTAIYASTAQNCTASSTGSTHGLYASSALNCYGSCSAGTGLRAYTAQNCYGSGGAYGLYTTSIAQNCRGYSSGGTALFAGVAYACTANSSGGTAIHATIGNSCYADAGTNNITYKYNMP